MIDEIGGFAHGWIEPQRFKGIPALLVTLTRLYPHHGLMRVHFLNGPFFVGSIDEDSIAGL